MSRVHIIDTTLRDGQQAPGLCFSAAQRLKLAQRLKAIGVDEIELGTPAMGPEACTEIAAIVRTLHRQSENRRCRLTAWCRATEADLEAAGQCGVDAVHLSLPVSALQLHVFRKDWQWIERMSDRLISLARRRFGYVSVGAMDASRAELDDLVRLAGRMAALGADRLRIADTVGLWNPRRVGHVVEHLRRCVPELPLAVHTHNDLGMATANALAAAQAGAAAIDVTVCGIGERAGNAALEQVALALKLTTDMDCGIRTEDLGRLCDQVAAWTGRPHPVDRPIVGANVFCHESGIHQRGMIRDARSFEPFAPQIIGRHGRQLVLGTHTGRAGLVHALRSQAVDVRLPADQVRVDHTLEAVRAEAHHTGGSVSPSRAVSLYQQTSAFDRPPDSAHSKEAVCAPG